MPEEPINGADDDTPETAHEFAYIDTFRTRSLLAYLFDGLPNAVQRVKNSGKFKGSLKVVEYETRTGQESETTSRDLDSLHFEVLELALEAAGFLRDVTDDLTSPRVWDTTIERLAPIGKIIRVSGPTTMVNYRKLLQDFQSLWPYFDPSRPSMKKGPKPVRPVDKLKSNDIPTVISALEELSSEGVSIRIEPHGDSFPNHGFVGSLNPTYFHDDGGSFTIRHGLKPQQWTTVAYVSRYADTDTADATVISNAVQELFVGGRLDRGALAKTSRGIGNFMGDLGMTEAPTAPGAAITPIAVYQHITKHEDV